MSGTPLPEGKGRLRLQYVGPKQGVRAKIVDAHSQVWSTVMFDNENRHDKEVEKALEACRMKLLEKDPDLSFHTSEGYQVQFVSIMVPFAQLFHLMNPNLVGKGKTNQDKSKLLREAFRKAGIVRDPVCYEETWREAYDSKMVCK